MFPHMGMLNGRKQMDMNLFNGLLKHGASLYKEAELFSLPITNPKGRHKTKGLISKTMTLHVRYRFWYISLPSSAKQQREMNMYVLHCILIIYHLSFYISENVVL